MSTNGWIFAAALCAGIFLPSSTDGNVSKLLFALAFLVSLGLIFWLAFKVGVYKDILLFVSIPIPAWLIICTVIGLMSIHTMNPNPLALFSLLGFIYSLRVSKLRISDVRSVLAAFSIVQIAIGVGMIFSSSVSEFMVAHYTNFYDDLVSSMISVHKPVSVFATHSLAGTFGYLFFFLTFRTYRNTGAKLFLVLAVLHAVMCAALVSTTSLAFAALAFAELAWAFKKTALVIGLALFLLVPAALFRSLPTDLKLATPGKGNGFAARYGANGNVRASLIYLSEHPFQPMGLNYRDQDTGNLIDSGPLHYLVRGSVPLLILMYGGLLLFLRRNLPPREAIHLFLVLLASELGFGTLIYIRSLLLLPAFVLYLGSLPTDSFTRQRAPSLLKRFADLSYSGIRAEVTALRSQ